MQEAQVQSLVEELGSHMLCSQKLKQYYNKFNKGLKKFLKNMLMKEWISKWINELALEEN